MRLLRLIPVLALTLTAGAQVLARPGWAGSGVTVEPWWRRAVFYRVTPALFQDSDGDGIGDLRGIAQRLDYIQSLGVDAIILALPPLQTSAPAGFDDLTRAASDHHLRLLVQLTTPDAAEARAWLSQGVAGLYVETNGNSNAPAVLRDLRHLTDSYPGERILLTGPAGPDHATHLPSPEGPQLTASDPITATKLDTNLLRHLLTSRVDGLDLSNPLLQLPGIGLTTGTPSDQAALDRTLATVLLTSRAAVIFDAGRELGLRSFDGKPVAMQWTPGNRTRPDLPPPPPEPKVDPNVYGTFHAYVVPKPIILKPADATVDPDTLAGFSTTEPAVDTAANGATANLAQEDPDSRSLLNLYRHLIALHHGNWSLRNGTQYTLDLSSQGPAGQHTILWIRRAPTGTRTAASIVVACNLSENPVQLSLRADFDRLHLREGALRPLLTSTETALLTSAESSLPLETTSHLILPAFTIFLGELYHDTDTPPEPTPRKREHH